MHTASLVADIVDTAQWQKLRFQHLQCFRHWLSKVNGYVRQTNSKGTLSLCQTESSRRNLDPAKEIVMVVMQAPSNGLNLRSNLEQKIYLHKLLLAKY